MLPKFLDVTHMRIITWVVIVTCIIVMFLVIKTVEKAMLRMVVAAVLLIVVAGSYIYQKDLNICEKTGKVCSFFNSKIPKVNAGVNDLNS